MRAFSSCMQASTGYPLINKNMGIKWDKSDKLKSFYWPTAEGTDTTVIKQRPQDFVLFRTTACPHRTFLFSVNQGQCLCSLCFPGRGSAFSQLLQYCDTPPTYRLDNPKALYCGRFICWPIWCLKLCLLVCCQVLLPLGVSHNFYFFLFFF